MPTPEELDRRFTYHAPDEATRMLHEEWRGVEREYAHRLNVLGESREVSLAFTKLEELAFWVHAHIARNLGD